MSKTIFLICFLFCISNSAMSQLMPEIICLSNADRQNKDIVVGKIDVTIPLSKSLTDYFQIVDTIDLIKNESDLVNIKGCDFQFKLMIHRDSIAYKYGDRQILSLESFIPPFHTWDYDITDLNNEDIITIVQELRKKPYDNSVLSTAYQNCISYALEGIFRSYGINPEPFFYRRSSLAEFNDLEVILKNIFIKVETLDNINKKTIKNSRYLFEDQIFLLFRNYKGEPIHACFNLYGKTWTKNGLRPYTSYPSPGFVIDTYNKNNKIESNNSESLTETFRLGSVTSIEIYKLNAVIFE